MVGLNKVCSSKIDIIIPYHCKDSDIFELCLAGCITNVRDLGRIYIVTSNTDLEFGDIEIVDEAELFDDGLTKFYVEAKLKKEFPELLWRSGWLFQQFIKMGCAYAIPNLSDYYLVVDADVVFLREVCFFHDERMLLAKSDEFHQPYFDFYERFLGESSDSKTSFVAHHMLICKSIMLELLHNIEGRFNKSWYDAVIDNIDGNNTLMFSEYETYGHYCESHYPDKLTVRRLRNIQRFKMRSLLKILLNQADYVTIHNYKKPENNPKTNPHIYKLFLRLVKNKLRKQKGKNRITAAQ